MKLLQLITLFLSLVLPRGMVEASANVDVRKKNNLATNGRHLNFLKHDSPRNITRMLKGGGRGGGM